MPRTSSAKMVGTVPPEAAARTARTALTAGRAQARRLTVVSPSPFLLWRLHTKSTPVVAAHYTRTNVLMAVGAFRVPPELGIAVTFIVCLRSV